MDRDLKNNILVVQTFVPAIVSAAADGASADNQGFSSQCAVVSTGAIIAAGDFGAVYEESVDDVVFTPVAPIDLIGAFPATLLAASVVRVGYTGSLRYTRLAITDAGGTSIALAANIILGDPHTAPTDD